MKSQKLQYIQQVYVQRFFTLQLRELYDFGKLRVYESLITCELICTWRLYRIQNPTRQSFENNKLCHVNGCTRELSQHTVEEILNFLLFHSIVRCHSTLSQSATSSRGTNSSQKFGLGSILSFFLGRSASTSGLRQESPGGDFSFQLSAL